MLNARQAIEESNRPGELLISTQRAGHEALIVVTDTGPGIPEDVLPRIFDVYFSTKKGGTGLGLPTTRRLIEEHGGRLTVESEVGKGTSFRIALPLTESTNADGGTSG